MSVGSPKIVVRVPQWLLDEIGVDIALYNKNPSLEQRTMSSFILAAIRDKLSHGKRSRSKKIHLTGSYTMG